MCDTYGIHVSAAVRGYMEDTCGIHEEYMMRYMYLKCIRRGTYLRCKIHAGYMRDTCILRGHQDTCGIHAGYMRDTCISNASRERCIRYEGDMWDTCGIHAGYMYPQWQSRYNPDTFWIHARYIAGYMRDTYLGGWGNVLMPSSCAAHL